MDKFLRRKLSLIIVPVFVLMLVFVVGCGNSALDQGASKGESSSIGSTTNAGDNVGSGYIPSQADFEMIDVTKFDKEWDMDSSVLGTYELSLTNHDPATSIVVRFQEEWAKLIYDATDGGVNITVYPGGTLASGADAYDAVLMGTADLAWLMASFYPSQLPISQTFNLVMLGVEDSEVAVETMWDLYEWSDALQKEYSKTKLLQIYSIQNFISTNGIAFTSLNDIKGMNIRSLAGTATDITTLLNANPISMGPGELYDAVSKHVIDGYILGWQGIRTFNLDEVTDYYCTMDLISILEGVIINTDVFNSLPEEYQEVLTYYSGREMSLEQARRMAEEDEDFYSSLDQNKIVKLDAETYDEFSNMAEKYNYNRVEGIDAEGFDGNAFLDKLYERAGYYQGIYSK